MKRRQREVLTERELRILAILCLQSDIFKDMRIYKTEWFTPQQEDQDLAQSLLTRGYLTCKECVSGEFDGAILCPPTPKGIAALANNPDVVRAARVETLNYFFTKAIESTGKK